MKGNLDNLSDRERETLRLLGRGHEAKSIASALGLSVHTVNERLRAARRKLGVSSSREAARLLLAHEAEPASKFGYKEIGVAPARSGEPNAGHLDPGAAGARRRLVPMAMGGIMLVGLLSVLMTVVVSGNDAPEPSAGGRPAHAMNPLPALFAVEDYPPEALAQGVQGSTEFRLQLNKAGRVEKCEIERSSGNAALDQATCRVITSRARFYPAINAAGRATPSVFTGMIEWKMQ